MFCDNNRNIPVARKGVQWFGNAAKYPLFQDASC